MIALEVSNPSTVKVCVLYEVADTLEGFRSSTYIYTSGVDICIRVKYSRISLSKFRGGGDNAFLVILAIINLLGINAPIPLHKPKLREALI